MSARILLVDDEPRNLALLEACLGPLGADLIRANGGREAVRLFNEHRPDLVLLDYVMPDLDGIEVLGHIRAQKTGTRVPVVLVTAHADRAHRLRGLQAGADEFLEKPIDLAVLTVRVNTLLTLKASQDALAASRDELERRHRAMERARREHKELTEFVVHDLKSPLSAVCANLDYARGKVESLDGELAHALMDATQAAQRLTAMIADLLVISRMEESDFPLRRESIAVTKLLRSVLQSFALRARAKGIAVATPADLGLEINADRTLLMRVLENILDNALRYTPEQGHIVVAAHPGRGVEISVSNDGPSIPAPQRQSIFEKFKRGDAEFASHGNAGLGLYFCKRAVEAHGGKIEVIETRDFPTSFRISLPH